MSTTQLTDNQYCRIPRRDINFFFRFILEYSSAVQRIAVSFNCLAHRVQRVTASSNAFENNRNSRVICRKHVKKFCPKTLKNLELNKGTNYKVPFSNINRMVRTMIRWSQKQLDRLDLHDDKTHDLLIRFGWHIRQ